MTSEHDERLLTYHGGMICRVLLAATLVLGVHLPLHADTIYLKNGRTIDTPSAEVQGDRVVFIQFGNKVAIPLSTVERIEENDRSGPQPSGETSEPSAPTVEPAAEPRAPAAEGVGAAAVDAPSPPRPVEPEQTREYWQDRVRQINAEGEFLQLELQRLRRVQRAFLFAHMSTAESRQQIEEVQERIAANERALPELRREARRQGIPPGWLRLRNTGGATRR